MPISKREEAIAAFEAVLATVQGITVVRTPNYPLASIAMPYAVILDGAETVDPQTSEWLLITTEVGVIIGARSPTQEGIGTALNAVAALVRAALGANPNLEGKAMSVNYTGMAAPSLVSEQGAPPQGTIDMHFEIVRQEAEFDPYSYMNGAGP